MKIPRWKRWLSWIWPLTIRTRRSAIHPSLTLLLSKGRFQLCTPQAIYSFGDLYVNFARTFRALALERLPGKDVLVLGLGLGSVIEMLENEHGLGGDYTAVEVDEAIIDLAKTFTLDELEVPLTIITADARDFLEVPSSRQFDLILLDIFQDVRIPDYFWTSKCLNRLDALLRPGGLLLDNRLYRSREDKVRTEAYLKDVFLPRFPHAAWMDVEGNRILIQDGSFLKIGPATSRQSRERRMGLNG